MEQSVTTPIEQALKTSSGIKEFDSFSNDGMSIITVQYEFGTDMKAKEAEVQQAVSGVQQMLPATAHGAAGRGPQLQQHAGGAAGGVVVAPAGAAGGAAGHARRARLQAIDGVQAVTLSGVQQMQLQRPAEARRRSPRSASRRRRS